MNELEQAVVRAAIEAMAIGREPSVAQLTALRQATHELIFSCVECNTARHVCPGCGAHVGHGEVACNNCAPAVAGASLTRVDGTELEEPASEPEPVWVERPWRDVRTGDTVRMPGTDAVATVTQRLRHPSEDPQGRTWHMVPGAQHWEDVTVQPGEVCVSLNGARPRWMKPDMGVEIQLPSPPAGAAYAAVGWEHRPGTDGV
jgi:hypothetical protein